MTAKWPVLLEATIPGLLANFIGTPTDVRGLENRTAKILRIDEIRIRSWLTSSSNPRSTRMPAFSTGEIRLRIGNEPVTAEFSPIPAVTWPVGDFEFEIRRANSTPDPFQRSFSAFVMRFKKPVYLAIGQAINVQVRHQDTEANTFVITAVCREVDAIIGEEFTPWFSFYKPPAHTDGTGNFEDISTSADLVNPFGEEILVERFISRVFSGADSATTPREPDRNNGTTGQFAFYFDNIRVRLEAHDGTQVARDATPIGILFDMIRKSWVVNSMLPPKGFYRAAVQSIFQVQVGETPQPVQVFIGMLGYRAVRR